MLGEIYSLQSENLKLREEAIIKLKNLEIENRKIKDILDIKTRYEDYKLTGCNVKKKIGTNQLYCPDCFSDGKEYVLQDYSENKSNSEMYCNRCKTYFS